ncbi:MAG: WD40 repeat domain-containing protein [Planctomycetota bacterium]|nr:WD40 repeat domain-containing protein [Planctomycetota bacterium]
MTSIVRDILCSVNVWDVATGRVEKTVEAGREGITSLAFSPDGSWLAFGRKDMDVVCLSGSYLDGHSKPVYSVAFSADGKLLASGGQDGTVKLWEMATRTAQTTLKAHSGTVRSLAFSSDGRWLASGGEDKTVKLWDVATGQLSADLPGCSYMVTAVGFSPDAKRLVAGCSDYRHWAIILWDMTKGGSQSTLVDGSDEGIKGLGFAFSPDGKLLASVSSCDSAVRIWDVSGR